MVTFITRAAQSAFNEAGYAKSDAYTQAQEIAEYVLDNVDSIQPLFGTNDEFELAYRVASSMVKYAQVA